MGIDYEIALSATFTPETPARVLKILDRMVRGEENEPDEHPFFDTLTGAFNWQGYFCSYGGMEAGGDTKWVGELGLSLYGARFVDAHPLERLAGCENPPRLVVRSCARRAAGRFEELLRWLNPWLVKLRAMSWDDHGDYYHYFERAAADKPILTWVRHRYTEFDLSPNQDECMVTGPQAPWPERPFLEPVGTRRSGQPDQWDRPLR